MFEFIFLGTSAGIPTKCRNVSATAIKQQHSKAWWLVDCGEGTQHQLLHAPLATKQLKGIFITHLHGDHIYGLPGLLASLSMQKRTEPLHIVGPKALEVWVRQTLHYSDAHMTYPLFFSDVESASTPLLWQEWTITPQALSHRVPCYAYCFDWQDQRDRKRRLGVQRLRKENIPEGPLWSALQQGQTVFGPQGRVLKPEVYCLPHIKPRSVRAIICGDNDSPECLGELAKEALVLVHEATYTQRVSDHVGPGPQHSSAAQIARFAEKSAVKHLILTHFSSRYHAANIHEIEDEAQAAYSGSLFLANDFDRFVVENAAVCTRDNLVIAPE